MINRLIFVLLLMFSTLPASAATAYHFVDCGTGAATLCVNGNDTTGDGSIGNPWRTCSKAFTKYPTLVDGDSLLFAKGSVQAACTSTFLDNANITGKAGRITIGAYTPAWDYTTCTYTSSSLTSWSATPCELPLLNTKTQAFWWGENVQPANPAHQRYGPIVSGLHIKGIFTATGDTVTIDIGSPGTVHWTAHGLTSNQVVRFTTTGALPTGYVTTALYYVVGSSITADTFSLAASPGGAAINTSGTQSGVHTAFTTNGVGCIRAGAGSDYSEILNNEMEGCSGGVEWQVNLSHGSNASGNGLSDYCVMRGNVIYHNFYNGFFGACNYGVMENNIYDSNGTTVSFDHNIYVGGLQDNGVETTTHQMVIRGNTITHNTPFVPGGDCASVILVVHGIHDGLRIENNTIKEANPPTNASKGNCYGIGPAPGYANTIAEDFNHVIIRNNLIVNVPSCIMPSAMRNSIIENNACYSSYTGAAAGNLIDGSNTYVDGNKQVSTNNVLRNNSFYFTSPSANVRGIGWLSDEQDQDNVGTTNVNVSNLLYYGSGSSATSKCFDRQSVVTGVSVTATNASPAVFTTSGYTHHLAANQPVFLTGTAPGGFVINTAYYVDGPSLTPTTFELAATSGGTPMNSSSTGSSLTLKRNVVFFTSGSTSISYVAHGLVADQQVLITSVPGTLPSGFTGGTWYYVKTVVDANTITLAATKGGTAITAGANGSGSIARATDVGQFAADDNNLCFYAGTAGFWDTFQTRANWNTYSGYDASSLTTDPTITAPSAPNYSLCPASGPAIGAGKAVGATGSSAFAYGGKVRSGTPDIGACQLGGSSIYPNAPDALH